MTSLMLSIEIQLGDYQMDYFNFISGYVLAEVNANNLIFWLPYSKLMNGNYQQICLCYKGITI